LSLKKTIAMTRHSCFKQKRNAECGATMSDALDRHRGIWGLAGFYPDEAAVVGHSVPVVLADPLDIWRLRDG
jgi:hypothetical protein